MKIVLDHCLVPFILSTKIISMQNNQVPFSNYPQNFNRTMQIVEPTYEQHIIKPPSGGYP